MAILHQQFTEFHSCIKLNTSRVDSLKRSRNALKTKIRNWFQENKEDEIQPKFAGQGSFEMITTINPIPVEEGEKTLTKYDLDYGVYFIEEGEGDEEESKKKEINTWHDWIYEAVEDHTDTLPERKTTCIRVIFSDGRHLDLPIYYKKSDLLQLAHRSKGWIDSDPKEFYEWFNEKKNKQLERIVKYLKGWKNYRETKNSNLKFPSGFELTILATNNYFEDDNDDVAFRKTVENIKQTLDYHFTCVRPTTPVGEDIFGNYSSTRKNDFLNALDKLYTNCCNANEEENRKTASEFLIKEFGDRFPIAPDVNDTDKSNELSNLLNNSIVKPKPYCSQDENTRAKNNQ